MCQLPRHLGAQHDQLVNCAILLGFETFAKSLRVSVSVSENLVSEKKSRFRFRKNLVSEKSLGFGFGKFGFGKKVSVSVSKKFGLGKKSRSRFRKIWSRKIKNPNNKNSALNDVPNLGLSPEMVPYKSQFCSQVPNFILVARCQAKSNISLINSTVNNNKKHVIFNLIVFVIVCFLSQRKCPYLNAFAECLLLNNVI